MTNKAFPHLRFYRSPHIRRLMAITAGIFFLLLIHPPAFCQNSSPGSGKDMEVLRMFFEEKDLFTSVTRTPKPTSQIAENVTIVTAKEIEAMNAHTVAEVLNRVPGLFVNFHEGTGTIGSTSLLHMQGSEDRHVLVLVDGIPWNSMSGGTAETNTIPVGIIKRIEIIKGPASSSWGSALGGVVHIITKSPGYARGPDGKVRTSWGEHETQDHRAEISGREGRLGYYLYGGRQSSDGTDKYRDFERNSFYSRFSFPVTGRVNLGLSLGFSRPDTGMGSYDYDPIDLVSSGENKNFWANATLDATLSRKLTLSFRAFRFEQESVIKNMDIIPGYTGPDGELYQETEYDESVTGASAKLVWQKDMHTAVLGADFTSGDMDQTIRSGRILQLMGKPGRFKTDPDVEKTGIYLNDTIVIDRLSVTPGIRYDYNSTTGSFLSPSLGLTYRLGKETILRGSVARGFTAPALSWTSGGTFRLDPNPSLEEERVWSYQAGVESAALQYLWVKATLFRHDLDDSFELKPEGSGKIFVNNGDSRRQGAEIEIETLPFYHTSIKAGVACVNIDPANNFGAEDMYTYNIGIAYDNPGVLKAELFGHYIWWDAKAYPDASYEDFIWNLNISRRIYTKENIGVDLFFTGHNIFNGDQYLVSANKNPKRWFEAGLKMNF